MTVGSNKDLKKRLRAEALARRNALDPQWRIEASLKMAEAAELIQITPGAVVSGFWPMRSEVDVRPLMFAFREMGARLCLPAILDKTTIVFRELVRGAPLVDMGFGTAGPGDEAEVIEPTLMLIPLAAFDARGHRIGYGGGYYDRAIERLQAKGLTPRLIGVAFDCQEVERVPDEGHDIVIPEMLTESGLRRLSPAAEHTDGKYTVFAFGTLKKDFSLHEAGLADATFLGRGRTATSYPMLVAGPWFAPMMFNEPGAGRLVSGELYEVDAATLAHLDTIESVGQPGNFRICLTVEAEGGRQCEAFAYVKARDLASPAHSGYLDDYQDRRFVPPWLRGDRQATG